MAKIKKIKEGTATVYPATIPQAVIDPTSGKSVRTELNEKFDKSSVVQTTGTSTTQVMSQNTISELINKRQDLTVKLPQTAPQPTAQVQQIGFDGTDYYISSFGGYIQKYDKDFNLIWSNATWFGSNDFGIQFDADHIYIIGSSDTLGIFMKISKSNGAIVAKSSPTGLTYTISAQTQTLFKFGTALYLFCNSTIYSVNTTDLSLTPTGIEDGNISILSYFSGGIVMITKTNICKTYNSSFAILKSIDFTASFTNYFKNSAAKWLFYTTNSDDIVTVVQSDIIGTISLSGTNNGDIYTREYKANYGNPHLLKYLNQQNKSVIITDNGMIIKTYNNLYYPSSNFELSANTDLYCSCICRMNGVEILGLICNDFLKIKIL